MQRQGQRDESWLALDHLPVGAGVLEQLTGGAWELVALNTAGRALLPGWAGADRGGVLDEVGDDGVGLGTAAEVILGAAAGLDAEGGVARRVDLGDGALVDVFAGPVLLGDGREKPGRMVVLTDARDRAALRDELARVSEQLAAAEAELSRVRAVEAERVRSVGEGPDIVGRSPALVRALGQADRVASTGGVVLILGETGSGKELLAQRIHARSPRNDRELVDVNCAALPESLLESELFGHERGAFTGADRQRAGRFELADGGTLFLDEVGELSPAAQARLLRVLQDGSFQRVGGAETLRVDVRVIAATHRDLAGFVRRGRFREDLFYRLNVFTIENPPLRDRREDLRPLAEFLHERHARRMGRRVRPLSDASVRRMMAYRWPGNIRELENVIERATILLGDGDAALEIELPSVSSETSPGGLAAVGGDVGARAGGGGAGGGSVGRAMPPRDALLDLNADQLQRLHVMHALETSGWRVFGEGGAAAKLGLKPQTLLSRMDKLSIPRPRAMRKRLG